MHPVESDGDRSGKPGAGPGRKGGFEMAIMRWDPFGMMLPMHRMTSMMPGLQEMIQQGHEWWPKIDAYTDKNDLVVKAEVPGVKPEDMNISLEQGTLTIQGRTEREEKKEEKDYQRMERMYGSFMRTVPVPEGVKESDVKANYSDGVLEVRVKNAAKLSEQPKRKAIPIQTGKTTSGQRSLAGSSSTEKRSTRGRTQSQSRSKTSK